KMIGSLDDQLGYVWCWVFPNAYSGPEAYANAIIGDIETKHSAVSATLEKEGKEPWPPLPSTLRDRSREPADRLRSAVVYVRSLVPAVPGGVTVFGLMPLEISDTGGYGKLAAELVQHQMPFPWCARVRFLLRDDPIRPVLANLAGAPRARALRTDFSPPALSAALALEAGDESLPAERRANAAMVAAGIDQAHGRVNEALARYEAMLDHYGRVGNSAMAALAANGIAGCKEKQGDIAGAERIWLAGLDTALQATPPALPVALNVLLGLVMLTARQGRWAETEAYLTGVADVAHVLFMPSVQAEALERRGIAQLRQGKTPEAERSWRDAIAIADKAGETDHALAARQYLRNLLGRQAGREGEAHRLEAEIAALGSKAGRAHPAGARE
ncbi:MAG: hypothetical protein JOY71_09135, partial [Acetobacteraceae bacterium]|nr:hypothetical protein [Acetobacteraceae bacterium]